MYFKSHAAAHQYDALVLTNKKTQKKISTNDVVNSLRNRNTMLGKNSLEKYVGRVLINYYHIQTFLTILYYL